jgi:hypothetical protein
MVSTKDLRDMFDEATKRASDAISDAKIPEFGRRDQTPGLLYFSLGLVFGALIGLVVAFLATPYNGEEARAKLSEQVDRMKRQREEMATNGGTTYGTTTASAYERS